MLDFEKDVIKWLKIALVLKGVSQLERITHYIGEENPVETINIVFGFVVIVGAFLMLERRRKFEESVFAQLDEMEKGLKRQLGEMDKGLRRQMANAGLDH